MLLFGPRYEFRRWTTPFTFNVEAMYGFGKESLVQSFQ